LCSIILLGKSADFIQDSKKRDAKADPIKIQRSKSFSEAKITKPLIEEEPEEAEGTLKRSQSVGERMNTPSPTPTKPAPPSPHELSPNADSISQKILFSNSTVSLQSVGLNEDYVKDNSSQKPEMVLTQRKNPAPNSPKKENKPPKIQKPLSEIDRYTMCSNRII
jgi:hypothetical protein